MADNQTTDRTPQGALVQTERGDSAQALVNANLDPNKGRVAFWSSMTPTTARDRAQLYNAVTGQVRPLAKMVDEEILLKDVILQGVDLTNAITGELTPAVRIVLIDDGGKMYGCVSKGIHNSLKNLMAIVGMPTYDPPIPVVVRSTRAKTGQFFSLELTGDNGQPEQQAAPKSEPPPPKATAKK